MLVALLGVLAATTEMGTYLARGAWEEARILWRRRPITEVAADTAASPALRRRLQLVLEVRDFAATRLGLTAGASFTTYSALARDTLVLVLSASRRDTLAAHTWWFPVVGRFPYKGFFDFAAAERTAATMRSQGFDTYLRPASAFSTLGWFNDPLLSTTVRQPEEGLVNTVIHELLHNTLFVRGHVAFNETFASVIGAHGAIAFYRARGDTAGARRAREDWEDDKLLASFWAATARRIDSVLALPRPDVAARVRSRDSVYAEMRDVLVDDIAPRLRTVDRDRLVRMHLDNAALIARRTYASELFLLDEVHRRAGDDVRATIALVRRLVAGSDDPMLALEAWTTREGTVTTR